MKKGGKPISFILTIALVLTTVCIPAPVLAATPVQTDPIVDTKVTVTNNAAPTKDVIYITSGTKSGDIIRIYVAGQEVFKSNSARSNSFRFDVPSGILDDKGGTIQLSATGRGKNESNLTSVQYQAAPKSLQPILTNIVVTNNEQQTGKTVAYDKVNITGLRSGDVFYVYFQDPSGTSVTPICKSSTAGSKGTAEATVKEDLPANGEIWITVKSTGRIESDPLSVSVGGVDSTRQPIHATATNNFGAKDRVMVTGLYPGDQVWAIEESTGTVYGSGKVQTRRTDIEISANSNRTGLVASGGSILIRVTTLGKATVTAGPFAYGGEPISSPVAVDAYSIINGNETKCGDVTIYNYEKKLDEIEIINLLPGDKVLITTNPEAPQKEVELKTATVNSKSSVLKTSLNLPAISEGYQTGSIRIYVTSVDMRRSDPVVVNYGLSDRSPDMEDKTKDPLDAATSAVAVRAITNSALKSGDEILISGVIRGDKIMVYELAAPPASGAKETSLTVKGSGSVNTHQESVVILAEFPTKEAGSVYVSYIRTGLQESDRIKIDYDAEKQTSPSGVTLAAMNLAGDKDTLTITGAPEGTSIQVYSSTNPAVTIKNSFGKVRSVSSPTVLTFALPNIDRYAPTGSGVVYVGVTFPGESESELIPVYYDPEPLQAWDTNKLTVQAVNIFGSSDYVLFSQMIKPGNLAQSADMKDVTAPFPTSELYPGHTLVKENTVITLYASTDPAVKTKIGILTISKQYNQYITPTAEGLFIQRSVSAKNLNPAGGTMAYTLTYPGKAESERIPLPYGPEDKTDITLLDVTGGAVEVINNTNTVSMADYVNVSVGSIVTVGSIIKIYDGPTITASALAKVTVTSKMTSDPAIKISLSGKYALGASAGSIWISVQEVGKSESDFAEIAYGPENGSQTPTITALKGPTTGGIYAIAVDNQGVNVKDFIAVFGLETDDTVTLTYKVSARPAVYTVKVPAGQTTATFSVYIHEAAWEAGNGYIKVLRKGMLESDPMYLNDMK